MDYHVFFIDDRSGAKSFVFGNSSMETCIEFALSLHRASNVPHEVEVFDNSSDSVCLSLVRKYYEEV